MLSSFHEVFFFIAFIHKWIYLYIRSYASAGLLGCIIYHGDLSYWLLQCLSCLLYLIMVLLVAMRPVHAPQIVIVNGCNYRHGSSWPMHYARVCHVKFNRSARPVPCSIVPHVPLSIVGLKLIATLRYRPNKDRCHSILRGKLSIFIEESERVLNLGFVSLTHTKRIM